MQADYVLYEKLVNKANAQKTITNIFFIKIILKLIIKPDEIFSYFNMIKLLRFDYLNKYSKTDMMQL